MERGERSVFQGFGKHPVGKQISSGSRRQGKSDDRQVKAMSPLHKVECSTPAFLSFVLCKCHWLAVRKTGYAKKHQNQNSTLDTRRTRSGSCVLQL